MTRILFILLMSLTMVHLTGQSIYDNNFGDKLSVLKLHNGSRLIGHVNYDTDIPNTLNFIVLSDTMNLSYSNVAKLKVLSRNRIYNSHYRYANYNAVSFYSNLSRLSGTAFHPNIGLDIGTGKQFGLRVGVGLHSELIEFVDFTTLNISGRKYFKSAKSHRIYGAITYMDDISRQFNEDLDMEVYQLGAGIDIMTKHYFKFEIETGISGRKLDGTQRDWLSDGTINYDLFSISPYISFSTKFKLFDF